MERNVWCLWEPPATLPGYLKACLRTIERNAGATVHLLTAADVTHLAPTIDRDFIAARTKKIAQQADYYRAHLLAAQGGLWLDIDCIVLRPLTPLFETIERGGFVARRSDKGHATPNIVGGRPGDPVLMRWVDQQYKALRSGRKLSWTALGALALAPAIGQTPVRLLEPREYGPIRWQEAHKLWSRFEPPGPVLASSPRTVMLHNEVFSARLRAMCEDQVMGSPMLLSRLLRVALGESTVEGERRVVDRPGRAVELVARKGSGAIRRVRRIV